MNIAYSEEFLRSLKKLSKKDKNLRQHIVDKINLFISNRNHPSLRLHKLQGSLKGAWSISVNKSIRILLYQDEDDVTFVDIGTHDDVYR